MAELKQRLDVYLFEKNFFDSREKARAAVMAGLVSVNGLPAQKPGQAVKEGVQILLKGGPKFVSRGGLKLEKALESFNIDLSGLLVLDVGASTGGFTDCALQRGARGVYAVDVGYGQLAWKLRCDPRVVLLERTNIKLLEPGALGEQPDFATIDVSFISLGKVLPNVSRLLKPGAPCVALIKPQFEAGREKVGKKGVVKDPRVHEEVIFSIFKTAENFGWTVLGLNYSPVRGPEGNIEYLIYLKFTKPTDLNGSPESVITSDSIITHNSIITIDDINKVVGMAHSCLVKEIKNIDDV